MPDLLLCDGAAAAAGQELAAWKKGMLMPDNIGLYHGFGITPFLQAYLNKKTGAVWWMFAVGAMGLAMCQGMVGWRRLSIRFLRSIWAVLPIGLYISPCAFMSARVALPRRFSRLETRGRAAGRDM